MWVNNNNVQSVLVVRLDCLYLKALLSHSICSDKTGLPVLLRPQYKLECKWGIPDLPEPLPAKQWEPRHSISLVSAILQFRVVRLHLSMESSGERSCPDILLSALLASLLLVEQIY